MLISWCPREFHGNTTICGAQSIGWVRIESPAPAPLVIKLGFSTKDAEIDFATKSASIDFTTKKPSITFTKVDP